HPLRQRAMVDLRAAIAAAAAVAMGADRTRLVYSAAVDDARHRHARCGELSRRHQQLSVGLDRALGGGALACRLAVSRGTHGLDPCLCWYSFLAPHQDLVSRLAALSVRLCLAVAGACARRLRRRG